MGVLEKNEIELVVKSWNLVEPNLRQHGIQYFQFLFKHHPDLQPKYFPFLHDPDDLNTLGDHGIKTVGAVGVLVRCLERGDEGQLVKEIHDLTHNHAPRGVLQPHFKLASDVLLDYLAEQLGSNLTPDGAAAWTKLLDTMVDVIGKEIDASDQKKCTVNGCVAQ